VSSELRLERGGRSDIRVNVSPRARVMRLRVDRRTGEVVLTVPRRASQKKALEWAAGHRGWIDAQLARVPAARPLTAGSDVPLFGIPHRIDWDMSRPRTPRLEHRSIVVGGPADGLEGRLQRWLVRTARELLDRETSEFAGKAGVTVARVGVGDPVSRWGSCAASGAIRYSWRLILAPDWVRRATVAHEVAHRVHMNHGPQFHALVATLLGADPRPARLWLRREGPGLHRIGRRG
jgi:predicted metal-dependent hydrolase